MATRASKRVTSKEEDASRSPTAQDPEPATKQPAKRARKEPISAAAAKADTLAPSRSTRKRGAHAAKTNDDADDAPSSDAEPEASGDSTGGGAAAAAARKGAPKVRAKKGSCAGAAAAAAPRNPPGPRYFLMKSEPEEFSLDDLAAKPNQTSHWEGVRNAQARNIMRSMRLGDEAFFYHSSCKVPAVVGVVKVVREAYPDHFAFDKSSKYYDPSSTPDSPKWWMVDVQLVRRIARPVTLAELRQEGARGPPIESMVLINKSRLSVQPVTVEQWRRVLELEEQEGPDSQAGEGDRKGQVRARAKTKGKSKEEPEEEDDDEPDEEDEEEAEVKGKTSKAGGGSGGGGGRTRKGKQQ